jgi:hypothetical protein
MESSRYGPCSGPYSLPFPFLNRPPSCTLTLSLNGLLCFCYRSMAVVQNCSWGMIDTQFLIMSESDVSYLLYKFICIIWFTEENHIMNVFTIPTNTKCICCNCYRKLRIDFEETESVSIIIRPVQ